MGERGKISETPLGPVFKEVALGNKDGVFYLKGPDRENVFAIIENGRTRHVSGDLGEGDPALIGCFSWSEGSYNFIEDIEADEKAFANNVSDELADILKKGVK
ncbi:MAG: DUF4388 domain-containing protein, partial [bacterium]|nr:DUF4388 domain-containing protein [bacterium]